MSVEAHEAAHVAAAVLAGRKVESVAVDRGAHWPGERMGAAVIPVGERVVPGQVPLCLIGYMSENKEGWPPPWPECLDERRERLGLVLRMLDMTEDGYRQAVQEAREIIDRDDFRRLRGAVARALAVVPRLEAADVEAIARAHDLIPTPEAA